MDRFLSARLINLASVSTLFSRYVYVKQTISRLFLFLVGNVLVKGISCITMPFLMHYLSPDDIAIYGMYSTAIMLLSTLLNLGLRQTLWLEYHHYQNVKRLELLRNLLITYIFLSIPLCFCIFFAVFLFQKYIPLFLIMLVIISSWLMFFSELLYQWLVYTKQTKFLIITQISGALSIFLTLLFLYIGSFLYGRNPCIALFVGILPPTGIACTYFYNLLKNIKTTVTMSTIKNYLKVGLPFVPTILANWCIISAQRFIIAQQCSLYDAGLYSIIDMMHQLCTFIILQPVAIIILPEIFEQFACGTNVREINIQIIRWMLWSMIGLSFIGIVGYFPIYYCVLYVIPLQYIPVLPLTLIAYLGNIFLVSTYFLQCLAQFKKKTFFLSTSLCASGIISIIFAYALIPFCGLAGAAWATTIAYIAYFVMCYMYNRRLTYSI